MIPARAALDALAQAGGASTRRRADLVRRGAHDPRAPRPRGESLLARVFFATVLSGDLDDRGVGRRPDREVEVARGYLGLSIADLDVHPVVDALMVDAPRALLQPLFGKVLLAEKSFRQRIYYVPGEPHRFVPPCDCEVPAERA